MTLRICEWGTSTNDSPASGTAAAPRTPAAASAAGAGAAPPLPPDARACAACAVANVWGMWEGQSVGRSMHAAMQAVTPASGRLHASLWTQCTHKGWDVLCRGGSGFVEVAGLSFCRGGSGFVEVAGLSFCRGGSGLVEVAGLSFCRGGSGFVEVAGLCAAVGTICDFAEAVKLTHSWPFPRPVGV
eukprot:357276-Chlamydomonas_euryale.AAC.2